jgi:hypothetical protein
MSDRSLEALLSFLDWTAEKGHMAKNTVGGRKAAVTAVLGVLDPEEKGDVTAVDLDSAMTRFVNLHSKKYNTSSLNVYRSRTNAALKDFERWLTDPLAFKPQGGKSEKKAAGKSTKPQKPIPAKEHHSESHSVGAAPTAQASANVFPIPIRDNMVVRIHGLPFDLTKAEAEKIANVVKAMAM